MMKLRDFSVGKRLGAGFAFLLLFVLFLAMASLVQGARYRSDLYATMGALNQRVRLAVELRHDALQLYRAMARAAQDDAGQAMQADIERQDAALLAERETISRLPEVERKSFDDVAEPMAALSALAADMTRNGANRDTKLDSWRRGLRQLQEQQLTLFDGCLDAQLKAQAALPEQSEQAFRDKAVRTVGMVILLMVLFGASIAWVLTRSVIAPLKHAVAIADQIAGGNLDIRIEVRGRDELGQLQASLKEMHHTLTRVIGKVRSASDNISAVSQDIEEGSMALGARTEAQAASLEETAASMEQLSSTVAHNADNVQHANRLATEAANVATEGGGIVAKMVTTMEDIRQSSDRIRNIVGVIDGIAFQTNILALNASVEAARVGEQGKGFAVVAGEVRDLARRAADAAKDIRGLIDDSMARVAAGCEYADQAGSTMQKVVASIAKVNHVVTEISGANREQASGLEQINKAVVELDEVAQRNAEQGQQAASNAETLMREVGAMAVEDNRFDDVVTVAGQQLRLNGAGTRIKLLVKLYSAALYVRDKHAQPDAVMSEPGAKRVVMVMLRDFSSDTFAQAFIDGIKKNSDLNERARFIAPMLNFGRNFGTVRDLKQGDVLNTDWVPGVGTVISINGKQLGNAIPGEDFYRALLKIWLGDNPVDGELKEAMLAGARR